MGNLPGLPQTVTFGILRNRANSKLRNSAVLRRLCVDGEWIEAEAVVLAAGHSVCGPLFCL